MIFELLDSLSLPGHPEKANEDAWQYASGAAVVLDGATSLNDPLMPGPSDAAWLSHFGARRLMAHVKDGIAPREALRAALGDAQKSFEALRSRAPAQNYEIPRASMMFVTAGAGGFEALWFGDCVALAKRPGAAIEIVGEAFDKRADEARQVAQLSAAKGIAPASGVNRPEFLEALRAGRNRVGAKGIAAFVPELRSAELVAAKAVAAPAGTTILLASDGFLALASDYGCYDSEGLLAAAQSKGLAALGKEVRDVEAGDPEGRKFARFKKSDDATAVLLRLT